MRRSEWLGQPCTSIYAEQGDKAFEDCEDWCLESKVSHCRYCKCRGCKHCHGDLSLPDWVLGGSTEQQCAAFGLCANASLTYPLCLSVWKGEARDGAPPVWSRCRTDVYAHQQWRRSPRPVEGGAAAAAAAPFALEHAGRRKAGTGNEGPLCVAAPLPARLLLPTL